MLLLARLGHRVLLLSALACLLLTALPNGTPHRATDLGKSPTVDVLELRGCSHKAYRFRAESGAVVIRLACGSRLISGGLTAKRPPGPTHGGGWTKKSTWGKPGKGTKPASAWSMPKIRSEARYHKVPWPRKTAKRAKDMSKHGVYEIRAIDASGKVRIYKYGITKVGRTRPQSQIAKCQRVMGARCRWTWVRTDVKGWYRARKVEASYATKYKHVHGRCPKGMPRCL